MSAANSPRTAARIGSATAITIAGGTIFVGGQPVAAATFTVTNTNAAGAGSLFKAVADANATAAPDTIQFAPGLSGRIQLGATTLGISEDVTIVGPGSDVLTVENYVGSNLVYIYNEAAVTIAGLTLDDAGVDAIAVAESDGLTLDDVVIDDAREHGIDWDDADFVAAPPAGDKGALTITNSTITGSGERGIDAQNPGAVSLTGSTIAFNVDDGVYIGGADSVSVTQSTVSGNGVQGLELYDVAGAVDVIDSSFVANSRSNLWARNTGGDAAVTGSSFDHSASEGGLYLYDIGGAVLVEQVTATSNDEFGVKIAGVDGTTTLRDSSVSNVGSIAVEIEGVDGDLVLERVTVDRAEDGIDISNSGAAVTLTDVTVDDAFDGQAIRLDATTGAATFTGITITESSDGIEIQAPGGPVVASNVTVAGILDDEGFEVRDAGPGVSVTIRDSSISDLYDGGIVLDDLDGDVTIERVTVDDTDYEEPAIDVAFDAAATQGAVTIRDVDVDDSQDTALEISGPFGPVLVERMTVRQAGGGINVSSAGDSVTVRDVDITTTENNDAVAIGSADGAVVVERVDLTDVSKGIDVSSDTTVTVTDVTVTNVAEADAVEADATGDVTLTAIAIDTVLGEHEGLDVDSDAEMSIDDVSITGVTGDSIEIDGATGGLEMSNVDIDSGDGAGVAMRDVDAMSTITDVTITDVDGIGVAIDSSDGAITFERVSIDGSFDDSIEIRNQAGDVTLRRVEALDSGAVGLDVGDAGVVRVLQSTIADAEQGGIQATNGVDLRLVNSSIVDNRVDGVDDGAAIELDASSAQIRHSTLVGNGSDPTGSTGAIRLENTSQVSILNSIATGNDGLPLITAAGGGHTVNVADSMVPVGTGLGGTTIENDDPELGELADNGGDTVTRKPLPGSPVIDAGNAAAVPAPPAVDQRNGARIVGPGLDLGAVEVSAGALQMVDAAVTVAEDGGSVDIAIERIDGQDGPATVTVSTANGSATAGEDYTTTSQVVEFDDNEIAKTVSVPILTDATVEPDETFTVSLSAPTGAVLGAATTTTVTITDATIVPEPEPDEALSALAPQRFADTRPTGETFDGVAQQQGKLTAGGRLTVPIAGRGGVPADAVGVIMNITAVQAEAVGFVTAHACLAQTPNTSALNYTAGVNLGNEVIAALDAAGNVCLDTAAAAHLTVDVVGFVSADSPLTPVDPARLLDTRAVGATVDGVAQGDGKTTAGGEITLPVAGRAGVPADAASVIVNITAVNPTEIGFVTVHPCVDPLPTASSLNHVPGVNRGNEIVAQLDANGDICLFTSSSIDLTVDIVAYVPAGSNLSSIAPARLLDTRPTGVTVDGVAQGDGKPGAGDEVTLQVTGRAGVPSGAQAAVLNVTAVQPEGIGFVTVHPCLSPRPLASSLNYVPGVNGGNEIVATLDASGRVCLYTAEAAHLTVDAVAYLT